MLVAWYNDSTEYYAGAGNGFSYYNEPNTYTIDSNTAAGGGTPPTTGWTTLATVTGNVFNSRVTSILNLAGANWIRMRVTSVNGTSGNMDATFHLDVISDANTSLPTDTWLFLGDSVTANSMSHQAPSNFMQTINTADPTEYPTEINGGLSSWPSDYELRTDPNTGHQYITDALNGFPGHYVSLDYGGTNSVSGDISTYQTDEATMIADTVAAGKQPVLRYSVTWGCNTTEQQDAPTLNTDLQNLFAQYPNLIIGTRLLAILHQQPIPHRLRLRTPLQPHRPKRLPPAIHQHPPLRHLRPLTTPQRPLAPQS